MNGTQGVTYECTALRGTGKKGILTPDEFGYYPVVVGGLDHYNSRGEYYPAQGATQLFESNSPLMRRLATGNLRGECGHPRPYGLSDDDFIARLHDIYEPNTSHTFGKIWLVPNQVDPEGRRVVHIMATVKPTDNDRGRALKASLDNPKEDTCFSIRSFTVDKPMYGKMHKNIKKIITWDWVNEPGISSAHKWNSPALESVIDEVVMHFSPARIAQMAERETVRGRGLESAPRHWRDLEAMVRPDAPKRKAGFVGW